MLWSVWRSINFQSVSQTFVFCYPLVEKKEMNDHRVHGKRYHNYFLSFFVMWRSIQILSFGGMRTKAALAFQIPTTACRRLVHSSSTDPRFQFYLKSSPEQSSMDSSQPSSKTTTTSTISSEASQTLLEEFRNPSNRRDQVVSVMSQDGGIKVTACTARNLVNDMLMRHMLTEVPADALGRTVICALLMSNGIQNEQIVQISMNGKREGERRN
jgi:hypothetical protein